MSKGLRWSEVWFRRALWLVALAFAYFLTSLGSTIIGDLPKIERELRIEDYLDRAAADAQRHTIKDAQAAARNAQDELEQARMRARVADSDLAAAREALNQWLATRRATQSAERDPELLVRTESVERLRSALRDAQAGVEAQEQAQLDARQREAAARRELTDMEEGARKGLERDQRMLELRVFGYRLALTLPLLVAAGWLFARKRHSAYWPFVWGFILFALVAFFVELVPYLPSWGGYVRYTVGIVVTVLVGRYAIGALNRYLERQKLAEAQPDARRREAVAYDAALARLAKNVCPGCERAIDAKHESLDFCPHCGIGIHDRCGHCNTRKSAFARYCQACGAVSATGAN